VLAGSGGGGDASFKGDVIALAAVLAGTGYLIATKRGRRSYDALTFTTAMMCSGAVVLFPLALVTGDGIGFPVASDWKWVVAMALLPGIGHVANNYSVAHLPLSVVSNASLLTPGVAAGIAWFLIDETILASDVIGMIITIAGLSAVIWSAAAPVQSRWLGANASPTAIRRSPPSMAVPGEHHP
jgi:drug/metabolite transporter (DMT)-like permease